MICLSSSEFEAWLEYSHKSGCLVLKFFRSVISKRSWFGETFEVDDEPVRLFKMKRYGMEATVAKRGGKSGGSVRDDPLRA